MYEQVSDRVEVGFEELGEKSLKNLSRSGDIYDDDEQLAEVGPPTPSAQPGMAAPIAG